MQENVSKIKLVGDSEEKKSMSYRDELYARMTVEKGNSPEIEELQAARKKIADVHQLSVDLTAKKAGLEGRKRIMEASLCGDLSEAEMVSLSEEKLDLSYQIAKTEALLMDLSDKVIPAINERVRSAEAAAKTFLMGIIRKERGILNPLIQKKIDEIDALIAGYDSTWRDLLRSERIKYSPLYEIQSLSLAIASRELAEMIKNAPRTR